MAWYVGGNSEYLNTAQKQQNCRELYGTFNMYGWTLNAIAALAGNIDLESTFNSALIEIGGTGHGLVQWTPPSDLYNVLDVLYGGHADWETPYKQTTVLYSEYQQTIYGETGGASGHNWGIEKQWYKTTNSTLYPQWSYGWLEWAHSFDRPDDLASAFCWEYLRPRVSTAHEEQRRAAALMWFEYLGGVVPPDPPGSKKSKFWIYLKKYY